MGWIPKKEQIVKLSYLFPGYGYKDYKTTKPDDFITPYIGKEYNATSEVLSIGLESIFEPTRKAKRTVFINGKNEVIYATIKDNKEYLYLIIGLILLI